MLWSELKGDYILKKISLDERKKNEIKNVCVLVTKMIIGIIYTTVNI